MDSSHKDKNPSNKNSKNTCNLFFNSGLKTAIKWCLAVFYSAGLLCVHNSCKL